MPDVYKWNGSGWVKVTDLPVSKFAREPKLKALFKTHDVYVPTETGGVVLGGQRLAKKERPEVVHDRDFFVKPVDLYFKPLETRSETVRVAAFTPLARIVGRWSLQARLETLAGAMIAARRFLKADVFLAPEYYWSYRVVSGTGTVVPCKVEELEQIRAFLAEQSRIQRGMVCVAGTVIRDPENFAKEVFNAALVFLDGARILQRDDRPYDKRNTGGFEEITDGFRHLKWGRGFQADQQIALGSVVCALQICKDTMMPVTYPAALRLVVSMNLGISDFGALERDVPLVIADGGTGSAMVLNGVITQGRPVNDLYVFNAPVKVAVA